MPRCSVHFKIFQHELAPVVELAHRLFGGNISETIRMLLKAGLDVYAGKSTKGARK